MDILRMFSGGFPLTIERLKFIQNTYTKAIKELSSVVGSGKIIVEGMVVSGSNISSGVAIIDGEVIAFEGGTYNARVAFFETVSEVPYNQDVDGDGNLDLKAADVVRTLKCAASGGVNSFNFSELVRVQSILQLMPKIGDVKMITRAYDPLVDIGWELLEMEDTFPMGAGGTHSVNGTGGENSVTLNLNQIPSHNHGGSTNGGGAHSHSTTFQRANNDWDSDNSNIGLQRIGDPARHRRSNVTISTSSSGGTHSHTISSQGGGQAHENRPKFKAFNFLVYVGI